jgi:hypothetical protein
MRYANENRFFTLSYPLELIHDTAPPQVSQVAAAAATMPDPNVLYSEAVKGALVDAMLDHSLQMNLGPEEWLTVAARASDGPMPPAGLSDLITIVLRVKGSDLSVYHGTTKRTIRQRSGENPRVLIYNPGMPIRSDPWGRLAAACLLRWLYCAAFAACVFRRRPGLDVSRLVTLE